MVITVDEKIKIELLAEKHAQSIFAMVDQNRDYLKVWLSFAERMQSLEFAEKFVQGSMQRNQDGSEFAFVIIAQEQVVGRIGVYKIDHQHKIGEIGYWLVEKAQGKGIIIKSCQALMNFCFNHLQLNRIEIKCGTENVKSRVIPERLHFHKEGVIRQGEWLYDRFIDLNLYAFLKSDI